MSKTIGVLFVVAVSLGARAPVHAASYVRSWQSCVALAEERGFVGTYNRGRKYKARFVRSCRLGTQL